MLPFRKMSLLIVNTRGIRCFCVAIYTVMEYEKIENISFAWFQAIYEHFYVSIYTVMDKKGKS